MSWQIGLSKEAQKCNKKLPKNIIERVKDALREIAKNPYNAKQLRGDLKGQYSFRIGDYRIVYIIREKDHTILILYIRHRKDAY